MGVEQLSQESDRTVVILQPGYLPWLGFFDQMYKSDVFVVYDDVQFDKNGWRNRNRIKTAQGWQWLTVPVLTKRRNKPTNKDLLVNNRINWRKKHLASIQYNYSKAPFFDDYFGLFERVYSQNYKYLIDLDMTLIYLLMEQLGLKRDLRFASQLNIVGNSTERLVSICLYLQAERLLEGDAGKNYLNESLFEAHGIEIEYHSYRHPVYNQLYGEFIPFLSVIDLMFNHGPNSLSILVDHKNPLDE